MVSLYQLKPESSAQLAIVKIVALGGQCDWPDVIPFVEERHRTDAGVRRHVIAPLLNCGFIRVVDRVRLVVTNEGRAYVKKYLAQCELVPDVYVGVPAARREHFVRPLDVARHRGALPYREGAFDYLLIPSRMGSVCKLPSGEIVSDARAI